MNTPVALFVFNRPEPTQVVFAAIRAAQPPILLVIADGPRSVAEVRLCEAARAVVQSVDWPCEVRTKFSETNLGCRRRMASGISWVFEQVEEAILLEDDCVPLPDFFSFCDLLLPQYREDERVMMLSGTNYLEDLAVPEGYVFSRYFAIWGWATWRRAWEKYDLLLSEWPRLKAERQLDLLYPPSMQTFWEAAFDAVHAGKIDTWDIQWAYSCVFNFGLSIVPRVNLVSNIGVVGTHSSVQDHNHHLPTFPLDVEKITHPTCVHPNRLYDDGVFRHVAPPSPSFARRVARKLRTLTQKA